MTAFSCLRLEAVPLFCVRLNAFLRLPGQAQNILRSRPHPRPLTLPSLVQRDLE